MNGSNEKTTVCHVGEARGYKLLLGSQHPELWESALEVIRATQTGLDKTTLKTDFTTEGLILFKKKKS